MQNNFLDWRQILIDYEFDGDSRLVLHHVEELVARYVLQEHVFNIYLVAVLTLVPVQRNTFLLEDDSCSNATASDEFSEFPYRVRDSGHSAETARKKYHQVNQSGRAKSQQKKQKFPRAKSRALNDWREMLGWKRHGQASLSYVDKLPQPSG